MIKLVSFSSQDWLKFNKHFNKCQKGLQVPFACQVRKTIGLLVIVTSVVDPDLYPYDPYVFWPPGSGSVSQRYGSGSFYHQANLDSYCFATSL